MDAPLNLRGVSPAHQMLGNSIADVVHADMNFFIKKHHKLTINFSLKFQVL